MSELLNLAADLARDTFTNGRECADAEFLKRCADEETEDARVTVRVPEACGTFDRDCVMQLLSLVTQSSIVARATGDTETLALNVRCLRVLNRMAGELK